MSHKQLRRAHAAFLEGLDVEIEQAGDLAVYRASAVAVSQWSVKDHLEHLSIAHGGIVSWVERVGDGDPTLETGGRPTRMGRIILFAGTFPRGRAKAPERTLPLGTTAEELGATVRAIRERVQGLTNSFSQLRASHATRSHFVLGGLNATQWLQFAVIHHNHHQKIIRDVLKRA